MAHGRRTQTAIAGIALSLLVAFGPLAPSVIAASRVPRGTVAGWVFFRPSIGSPDGLSATVRILYWDDDRGQYLQQQQTVTAAAQLTCGLALPAVGPYFLGGSCYAFSNIPKSTLQKARRFVIQVTYDSTGCRVSITDSYAWYNPLTFKWEGIVLHNGRLGGSGTTSHTCR